MQVNEFLDGNLGPPSKKAKKKAKAKPGKVIVVGAGPAGLAAALHLKVPLSLQGNIPWIRRTHVPTCAIWHAELIYMS